MACTETYFVDLFVFVYMGESKITQVIPDKHKLPHVDMAECIMYGAVLELPFNQRRFVWSKA